MKTSIARVSALLLALLAVACYASAATTLTTGQNVTVQAAGKDAGGNDATIGAPACTIDNHAMAYCVVKPGGEIWVVSRGPLGNFRLTVTADNSAAQPITSTADFTVVPGPAASIVLTISAPFATWAATPPIPAGW